MSIEKEGPPAPYLPWQTFKSFITNLNGKVIPSRIDNTLISNMSGAYQSQLRATLRFLDLVRVNGAEDEVNDNLRKLVSSVGTPEWKYSVDHFVTEPYSEIVEGLDLTSATQGQLTEAFRQKGGVQGSALIKAVRFYLTAMKEAEAQLSPHFKQIRDRTGGGGGSRPRARKAKPVTSNGDTRVVEQERKPELPPNGVTEVPVVLPGGKRVNVWVPDDLSEREEKFVLATLRGFFELKREEKNDAVEE